MEQRAARNMNFSVLSVCPRALELALSLLGSNNERFSLDLVCPDDEGEDMEPTQANDSKPLFLITFLPLKRTSSSLDLQHVQHIMRQALFPTAACGDVHGAGAGLVF